jgi:hypothetical protein
MTVEIGLADLPHIERVDIGHKSATTVASGPEKVKDPPPTSGSFTESAIDFAGKPIA